MEEAEHLSTSIETNINTVTLYAVWEAKPIHSNLQRLGRKRAENRAGSI